MSRGVASIASKITTTGPEDAKTKARCGEGVRANISGRRFGSKDAHECRRRGEGEEGAEGRGRVRAQGRRGGREREREGEQGREQL